MGFRTQAQVDRLRLPEGKIDAYVWDDEQPGLSVRLKGKARTWVVWYAVNGKRRKYALGAVGDAWPLKKARTEAGRAPSRASARAPTPRPSAICLSAWRHCTRLRLRA